jgi:hypothetical protein
VTRALHVARGGVQGRRPAVPGPLPAGDFSDVFPDWEPAAPDLLRAVRDGTAREQAQWIICREPHRITREWRAVKTWLTENPGPSFSRAWNEAYFARLDQFVGQYGETALMQHYQPD